MHDSECVLRPDTVGTIATGQVSANSPRCILLRTVALIIAPVTVFAALLAGVLAPYHLSVHIAQISLLALLAIGTFAASSLGKLR
jgi:hypothetical protein